MEKNKTALQQFIEWGTQMISAYPANKLSFYEAIDKAEEFLEVEKENIVDAFNIGMKFSEDYFDNKNLEADNYYNETYGK